MPSYLKCEAVVQTRLRRWKLPQNAHAFEHGCSYAVKHKEVRERP